jgi:NAD(P)-dependent dehydrogenase (short-subunit alcohol dehydrogenase family)
MFENDESPGHYYDGQGKTSLITRGTRGIGADIVVILHLIKKITTIVVGVRDPTAKRRGSFRQRAVVKVIKIDTRDVESFFSVAKQISQKSIDRTRYGVANAAFKSDVRPLAKIAASCKTTARSI